MHQRLFLIVTLVLSTSLTLMAQQWSAPQRSYQQARRVLDDAMARGLRQAALLILAGAALGLIAGAVWAAVSDTGFARATEMA